jgi:hypothetical protein
MTVTWTSGYGVGEAYPFVEWGMKGSNPVRAAADTTTFGREKLCGTVPTNCYRNLHLIFHGILCILKAEHQRNYL